MIIVWFKLFVCGCLLFLGSEMAPASKSLYTEVARESGLSTKQAKKVLTSLQVVIARELSQGRADLGAFPHQEDSGEG